MNELNRRDVLRMTAAGAFSAVAAMQASALQGDDETAPGNRFPAACANPAHVLDMGPQHGMGPQSPRAQTSGAANSYTRGNPTFLQDYTNLLHWCGRHGIDGVVVWLLPRHCHGGLESAKRLCEVAARENVRSALRGRAELRRRRVLRGRLAL